MYNIKAVILDLDGTLLNDSKKISNDTINFLKNIKDDIKIIPASARQFCTIKPYLEQLDLLSDNNYTICFNGSLIVNNIEQKIFDSYIDSNTIIEIDNFILNNNIDWIYSLYDRKVLRSEISNIKEFVKENKIYKIVGLSTTKEINKIRNNLPKCILDNFEVTSSELNRIELVNKGMTKVNAIKILLNNLNIDKSNVVAIGDGENDIDMLKYVGCGIAMLNSPENVKSNADMVTKYSNNENGVYFAIKDLLIK